MYQYKTKPYEHQRTALNKGGLLQNFAYFMEMGTGKTKVAIDNATYLYQQKEIKEVIVIAPNSVYRNWLAEIMTHSPIKPYTWVWKLDKQKDLDRASKSNALGWCLSCFSATCWRHFSKHFSLVPRSGLVLPVLAFPSSLLHKHLLICFEIFSDFSTAGKGKNKYINLADREKQISFLPAIGTFQKPALEHIENLTLGHRIMGTFWEGGIARTPARF